MKENDIPSPERVNCRTLALCRERTKEPFAKSILRGIYTRYLKAKYDMPYLGEGFRWGKHWKMRIPSLVSVGHYAFIGPYVQIIYPTVIGDLTMVPRMFIS